MVMKQGRMDNLTCGGVNQLKGIKEENESKKRKVGEN